MFLPGQTESMTCQEMSSELIFKLKFVSYLDDSCASTQM